MLEIKKFNEHISYFNVPYKDIYVGIYVIKTPDGAVLFDTAANDADVDHYIVPALEQLRCELQAPCIDKPTFGSRVLAEQLYSIIVQGIK